MFPILCYRVKYQPLLVIACHWSTYTWRETFFHGPIPPTLFALRGLHELDLSRNNLSGQIPNFLANLSLQMLNLSYNNLEGEVPTGGVFSNATGLSIIGNSGLCGGISELRLPRCNFSKIQRHEMHHKWRLIVAILSGFVAVVLLVGFISLYAICCKKKRKEPETFFLFI